MSRKQGRAGLLLSVGLAALLATTHTAAAQQTQTGVLQRVQAVGGAAGTCPAVFISFNESLAFRSVSFSPDRRTATIILARETQADRPDADARQIETYHDVEIPGRGPVTVALDTSQSAPILTLRFTSPIDMEASQAGESSIVLLNIRPAGATSCGIAAPGEGVAEAGPETGPEGVPDQIETDFAAARAAIVDGNYPQAIRLLTRLLAQPAHERSMEAQELLGLARERNGQLAQAQAEYETYLALYPDSDGAPRVRQRLAAILTAQAQPQKPGTEEGGAEGPVLAGLPEEELPPVRSRGLRRRAAPGPVVEEPEPTVRGLVSSYYYRSQGSTVFTEFNTGTTDTDDDVYNDTLVTSLDVQGEFENEARTYSWRIAGDSELDFGNNTHTLSVSRAYIDIGLKSNDLHFRLGRQSKNEAGVQGRFDGVETTLPQVVDTTVSLVFGSPAESSKDAPFESEKLILGVSAEREDIAPGLDATVYAVHQMREGYTDRQAIGLEMQYQEGRTAVSGVLDYDVYFNKVSFARVSGTWLSEDQSSFSITADHVNSPSLSFSNALTGQAVTSLEALNASFSTSQMKQLALDRTQQTSSLTIAHSRPFREHWQFSVDGSVYYTTGTPASGGVAAQPAPGTEYFSSVQFVGNNIFSERDTVSVSLRYANASTSDLVLLDTYRRSNAGESVRWKPRLQVGYRKFTDNSTEWFAVPSVNMTYKMNESTDFELELGGRFSTRTAPAFSEESNEFYVTAGFNRQF